MDGVESEAVAGFRPCVAGRIIFFLLCGRFFFSFSFFFFFSHLSFWVGGLERVFCTLI
jgi:hypothetical protein